MWRQPPQPGCVATHTVATLTGETTHDAAPSCSPSGEPPPPASTLLAAVLHPPQPLSGQLQVHTHRLLNLSVALSVLSSFRLIVSTPSSRGPALDTPTVRSLA
ncbi:hypothetical protein EYF80_060504 [Liparis tanakae]|uniref:Uncharacterized protein n=1 Tax=Liparis tanakae TaxID=230148 RepID=A0A4Z2EKS4_9TELE|nr:hypothetical protein EYF80_060504 [Liparis tanakae]